MEAILLTWKLLLENVAIVITAVVNERKLFSRRGARFDSTLSVTQL